MSVRVANRSGDLCLLSLTLTVLLVGCGDVAGRVAQPIAPGGSARVGGTVVSTVDGEAITLEDVRTLVRGSRLDAAEALRRLQAERLLMTQAERRGRWADRPVRHVTRQALVQALLDQEAATATVSDAELRAAYEREHDRFDVPERRASLHVLAFVEASEQDKAAYAFIRRVRDELAASADPQSVWTRYQLHVEPGLRVSAERIPAVDRHAPFVKPYLDALFGVTAAGVVAQPVRTRFGWHAIVVTEITPASHETLEAAREELRAELLREKRRVHTEKFLRELGRDVPVQVAPGAAGQVAGLAP